jgi:tetratricopeptide (TPR) repeat protein
MREVESLWGPSPELGCVLSIGTGASSLSHVGSKAHKVLIACTKLATNAEAIARDFNRDQGEKLQKEGKYFRFNVVRGLQGIGLEEWRMFDRMDAATKAYLDDVAGLIQLCCHRLKDPYTNPGSPDRDSNVHSPLRLVATDSTTMDSGIFEVPLNSSPHFTGRTGFIQDIRQHFSTRRSEAPQTVVLSGLGGMGKTQIALRYFETNKNMYSSVLFVQCNSKQEATDAFVRFASLVVDEELRVNPTSNYDEAAKMLGFSGLLTERPGHLMDEAHRRVVKAVGSWLGRQPKRFLLIMDNADDPNLMDLGHFIPHYSNGDIIITSRDSGAKAFGKLLEVQEMSKGEAVSLLRSAAEVTLNSAETLLAAEKISEALGYLPLAIDLACGYLVESKSDIRHFLSTYELHYKSVLSKVPNYGMLGYKKSAFTTWEMSFGRLESESPESASLLQYLGFMHCKDICESLFPPSHTNATTFVADHGDTFVFDEAFELLCKLSLMRRNDKTAEHTYEIHKVVHLWIKERLNKHDRAKYSRGSIVRIAQVLAALTKHKSAQTRKTIRRLYPHVEAAWTNLDRCAMLNEDSSHEGLLEALEVVSHTFKNQGYYDLAERVFIRMYRANIATYGNNARQTLHAAVELAEMYKLRGSMADAEKYYRLALDGFMHAFGPNDKVILQPLHDLAGVLRYKGDSQEAIELYQKSLEGRRQEYGDDARETLETMDALADLYQGLKQGKDAEPLRLQVLQARQALLGPKHADTIKTALNLGLLYSNMGEQEKALSL